MACNMSYMLDMWMALVLNICDQFYTQNADVISLAFVRLSFLFLRPLTTTTKNIQLQKFDIYIVAFDIVVDVAFVCSPDIFSIKTGV